MNNYGSPINLPRTVTRDYAAYSFWGAIMRYGTFEASRMFAVSHGWTKRWLQQNMPKVKRHR